MSRMTDRLTLLFRFFNFFFTIYSCHSKLDFFLKIFFSSFLFAVLEFRVPDRYRDVLFVICHFSFYIGYINGIY